MSRAVTLRGLVGIAAAGGHRVRACGQRWDAGWRGFRAGASGSGGRGRGKAAPGSSARRQVQVRRGASASAGNRAGSVSGGFESEDGKLSCGYSSYIGMRPNMEDCYDIKLTEIDGQRVNLFGVFDGHGGNFAAEYLKENLFKNLMKHPEFLKNTKLAIRETYLETNKEILEILSNSYRDDGSTALTAVLMDQRLYVANVGDSRAIAIKAGKAVALSKDHKPNSKDERKRIEDAGGFVVQDDTWRVGGILAMSRAFGNRLLKKYVKPEPDIQYLVLATDGLWDAVRNQDAISILKSEDKPQAAAVKLTELAYARKSTDNITCIVVQFHHDK
ncbi:hypothetical protein EJB05_42161, partial [Eragrostis curvula]